MLGKLGPFWNQPYCHQCNGVAKESRLVEASGPSIGGRGAGCWFQGGMGCASVWVCRRGCVRGWEGVVEPWNPRSPFFHHHRATLPHFRRLLGTRRSPSVGSLAPPPPLRRVQRSRSRRRRRFLARVSSDDVEHGAFHLTSRRRPAAPRLSDARFMSPPCRTATKTTTATGIFPVRCPASR